MPDQLSTLLSRMSLRDKAGQMTQLSIDAICRGEPYQLERPLQLDRAKMNRMIVDYGIGSILNVGTSAHSRERWQELIGEIQSMAVQDSRHGIPILYGIDAIHGPNYTKGSTLFPQQLGLAASWNPSLVEDLAAISAYETRASGLPWNFSPVLDIGRHPAWPRLWETFGEDVHLCTCLGLAMVRGYQGSDLSNPFRVAACLKHFTGYGLPLSGKDRTPAWIAERQLQEYFIPAFAAAIESGAATVMINSGEINGIPVHASYHILTTILREQLGFKGVAVTDWEDIQYLHSRHRIAETAKEAVRIAIMAGIDMSMVPMDARFADYLVELVEEGAIPESRLDVSVRRILQLKYDLGLFEHTRHHLSNYTDFGGEAFRQKSLEAASESLVLLKNDEDLLPLSTDRNILLTGPAADTLRSLNGGWSYTWQGERTDQFAAGKPTILAALENRLGKDRLRYTPGVNFDEVINIAAAVQLAETSDVIVLCLGETSYTEFFGSIHDLYLEDAQVELARAMVATGKPIVLVLTEGRPRLISKFEPGVKAILAAFLPGNEGGEAIADVLFGAINPSGKLPVTYPKYPNSLIPYDHKYTEVLKLQGQGGFFDPQFEFGHGLSYTTFRYQDLVLDRPYIQEGDSLKISVAVTNTGMRMGKEVVQLYISDLYASITPPVKRLRGFEKITLEAGESRTVSFSITTRDLAFVGENLEWITEPGGFKVQVEQLEAAFEVR